MRKDKLRNAILKVLMEDLEDTATWNGGGGIPSNGGNYISNSSPNQTNQNNYINPSTQPTQFNSGGGPWRDPYRDLPKKYPRHVMPSPPDWDPPIIIGQDGWEIIQDSMGYWHLRHNGMTLEDYGMVWNPISHKWIMGWRKVEDPNPIWF